MLQAEASTLATISLLKCHPLPKRMELSIPPKDGYCFLRLRHHKLSVLKASEYVK
jgi:hypothetical protein